jgi:glycosyltransferase involved in cell wall biosynthesis
MAKIVCISKYPPLEGGIAARTYWLTKALSERGHEIHVVTDAIDASPEYTVSRWDEPAPLPDVSVRRPDAEVPWHIPDDRHRALCLLNTAVRVINEVQPDIIDTGYLVPYGIVGYLASRMTGVPFALRHGGSDIAKFVSQNIWQSLFEKVFEAASVIITDHGHLDSIRSLTSRIAVIPPYVPDPILFNSSGRSINSPPVLAIIGKANYYWRHKGWHRITEIIKALGDDYRYLFVSQGKGLGDFRAFMAESRLGDAIEWEPFVPPWAMPALVNRIDALFVFENDLHFPEFSNLVLEALYSGVAIITDAVNLAECYGAEGVNIKDLPGTVLPVRTGNSEVAAEQIAGFFDDCVSRRPATFPAATDYNRYITANEETLLMATKAGSHQSFRDRE